MLSWTLWGWYYYSHFLQMKKQRRRSNKWLSQSHKDSKLPSWHLFESRLVWLASASERKPQSPFKSLSLNTFLVGNHSPVLIFPWKTIIMVGGRFRVGCVSLHTVNGFDYMFLASSFWERLPLVIQYNQIISYVNSRLAQSQRRFHQREGENETVFPAPESNLLCSRKRSRVNDRELGKGCRYGSEHYQEAGTKNGC